MIKKFLKRCFRRTLVWLRKRLRSTTLDATNYLTDTQSLAVAIVKKSIANTESELLIAPISDALYINHKDVYIKIEYRTISIVNGKYSYYVEISETDSKILTHKFYAKMEAKAAKMEAAMNSNTEKSLKQIYENLGKTI